MNGMIFINPEPNQYFTVKIVGKTGADIKFEDHSEAIRFAEKVARKRHMDLVRRRKDGIFSFKKY